MGTQRTVRNLVAASALSCAALFGQAFDPGIGSFSFEGNLALTSIGLSGTPNIPADTLASLQGGAIQIRQLVNYIPDSRALQVRHYVVQANAPNPTPAGTQLAVIEDYRVVVTQVIRSTSPQTITMIGNVDTVSTVSPFGRTAGLPFIYSFGYDAATSTSSTGTTTPTKLNTIALAIPGIMTTFIPTGTATLTFGSSTTTPPGGGLKANAGSDFSTVNSEIVLDASQSTAPTGRTLTYAWRVVSGPALVLDPTAAKTRVQLSGNFTTYVFEVTVTDNSGATDKATVRVTYSGRF